MFIVVDCAHYHAVSVCNTGEAERFVGSHFETLGLFRISVQSLIFAFAASAAQTRRRAETALPKSLPATDFCGKPHSLSHTIYVAKVSQKCQKHQAARMSSVQKKMRITPIPVPLCKQCFIRQSTSHGSVAVNLKTPHTSFEQWEAALSNNNTEDQCMLIESVNEKAAATDVLK